MNPARKRFSTFATLLTGLFAGLAQSTPAHETLRLKNDFSTPEAVLQYFLARDAEGFVWSGLLDSERNSFTTWTSSPRRDSFYLAQDFTVQPSSEAPPGNARAFDVVYRLESVMDASGTRVTPYHRTLKVRFVLTKEAGNWRISEPTEAQFSPVLLRSRVEADLR